MQPIYKGIWLRLKFAFIYIKSRKDKGEKITIKEIREYVNENIKSTREKIENMQNNIQENIQNIIKDDEDL